MDEQRDKLINVMLAKKLADAWAGEGLSALGKVMMAPVDAAQRIMGRGPVMLSSAEGEGANIGKDAFDAGSVAMGGAPFVEKNALGTFGGELAKTADLKTLLQARTLAKEGGADPGKIWKDTGWFQGGDGKWRFEIPDDALKVKLGEGTGATQIEHPELHAAYPELANLKVRAGEHPVVDGGFSVSGDELYVVGPNDIERQSAAVHELQHFIQEQEGFPKGSDPAWHLRDNPLLSNKEAHQAYAKMPGELEAYNVQGRLNGLTPEQRPQRHPLTTEDIIRKIVADSIERGM